MCLKQNVETKEKKLESTESAFSHFFSLQLSEIKKAYIAGFLEVDGCINAQIVKRSDYKLKFQIRVTVTFYQKTSRKYFLLELHKLLNLGVIRHRKDNMSEYTITGFTNEGKKAQLFFFLPFYYFNTNLSISCYKKETSLVHFKNNKYF